MENNFFIGIDVGTTSIKGVLADVEGKILQMAVHEYVLDMQMDRCELNADEYWSSTKVVIQQLLKRDSNAKQNVRGLSFSSQGETLICVDELGTPLRKAIVWLDNRSLNEAAAIETKFSAEHISLKTGQPRVLPLWPATRIAWLRTHDPMIFRRVHKYLLVEDYLIFKLTGKYATEQTLVSSTLYYDIRENSWWPEMLAYLGITTQQLPEVYRAGTNVGPVLQSAAAETGLSANTVIVAGAYDHVAGALGAGNLEEGDVSETTGTSMAMVVTLDNPIPNYVLNVPMQCHAVPGKYLLLPYGQTAGFVLKWFKDEFCQEEANQRRGEQDIYDYLTAQAERVPAGCDGIVMLPHLMGSGSPEFNAKARGVIAGITSNTTKDHFVRAILEGVACMMKRNIDLLRTSDIEVKEIKALGGGAKSPLWNQIKADVSNIPVTTVVGQETAALGAVILAAVGCGFFSSIEAACTKMVKHGRVYHPDSHSHEIYKSVYARYVNLTHTLEKFWDA